jgi:hypothetical protein
MKKILLLLLITECVLINEVRSQNKAILYKDYRLFMVYTRDSIMRELLSTQLCDFSNYCELKRNKKVSPRLIWDEKINLNHEEILDILTNAKDYGYYNFFEEYNNIYFVIPKYLNYRFNRNNKDTVNISLDLDKLKSIKVDLSLVKFGLDNNCNKEINDEDIKAILTDNQIIAFNNWKNSIGLENAQRMTRKKILF